MPSGKAPIWLLVLLLLLFPACEDGKKDPYSGFSKIVAERNEARKAVSEQKAREKGVVQKSGGTAKSLDGGKGGAPSGSLSERQVRIVDAVSGAGIARGVAYLNRDGKIVRIKILKN